MAMVTVSLGDQTLGSHTIANYPFIVGRDPESDIHIDNIGVSRQHCQFLWADGTFQVQDLKSSNGTQINGEKVEKGSLKDGDEIRLGKYKLVFHQAAGEPPPPPKGKKGMAEMLEEVVDEKPAAAPPADGMKTFQMSADLIRAQAGIAASAGGQRAGELAKSLDEKKGGTNKGLLFGLIGAGVVVIVLVVVIAILLAGK